MYPSAEPHKLKRVDAHFLEPLVREVEEVMGLDGAHVLPENIETYGGLPLRI